MTNNMNASRLFLVDQVQFGYHTGNYQFCKHLKDYYSIDYICKDHALPKIHMDGVRILYISRKGNFIIRSIRFLKQTLKEIRAPDAVVFIKYMKGISLALRLFGRSHMFVLDIRSGSVNKDRFRRWIYDCRLKFEARFFKNVTVISQGLAERLNIGHRAHILPLGAEVISTVDKRFQELRLLYVGTLVNRKIEMTLYGLKRFYEEIPNQVIIDYTIIGTGSSDEELSLKKLVHFLGLNRMVSVLGRVPYTQLRPFFDSANVGVSYIPLTPYYDVQPPFKTFEYLLSGMPVIATHTSENVKVISQDNGVLVGDSVDDFYSGLKMIWDRRAFFDSEKIRKASMRYSWETIVKDNLKPYLERIHR